MTVIDLCFVVDEAFSREMSKPLCELLTKYAPPKERAALAPEIANFFNAVDEIFASQVRSESKHHGHFTHRINLGSSVP